jgi:mono/diheme cytochrome c family protein
MIPWSRRLPLFLLGCLALLPGNRVSAAEKTPAERGREALLGRSFDPATVSFQAYESVWKQWGLAEKPSEYASAVQARYGLHPAPFENHGLPMGLREVRSLLGVKGIGVDCLLCHGGSIAGQSYLGLGNASLDLSGLFEELSAAGGLPAQLPYRFSNTRGTIEATATLEFLLPFRDNDLNVRPPARIGPVHDQLCEDTPAWWLLKKKRTMYHGGSIDAGSLRSLMTFMLSPLNSGSYIKKQEPIFADIKAFILSLEPPKYTFPVDQQLATRGQEVFTQTCARCHGTYGANWTYPNKIVDMDVVGTDPALANTFSEEGIERFRATWFGQQRRPDGTLYPLTAHRGYQAPPLDGVWATAPYFHNGSVPTLYHVLNSKARPRIYTRSYRTDKVDYDPARVGWMFTVLERGPAAGASAYERRRVYDTTQRGRHNTGHTFGDKLTEDERMAVIEYLKTL